ncbi:MAG: RIP metalloprotease RseP [Bdellovibrionota bacterium]
MFTNVFIPIFLFGMLVFIHELGHFTVAKLCNVYVERFAIGFGPALLKKKWGETEYALCAFPLGGYVKMRGEELPEHESEMSTDPRSFAQQNVWKRIAIVIMGPTANFVLPIILFTVLFLVGLPTPSARIGTVVPGSVAEQAGLKAGDKVISVQDQSVNMWTDLTKIIQSRANQETKLVIEREGQTQTIAVTPKLDEDRNEFGESVQAGKIGIDMIAYQPLIGVSNLSSEAYTKGFRTGDIIKSVNGTPVMYWWQLDREFQTKGEKTIVVDRKGKTETFTISAKAKTPDSAGIERGELFINKVMEKSIAAETGLKSGDKIESINGTKLQYWADFRDAIQKNNGEKINLGVIRDGKTITMEVAPAEVRQRNEMTNETKKVRQLGVISESINHPIDYHMQRYTNVFTAIQKGFMETWNLTVQTFVGLGKLASGKLGVNSLGGPISIFAMASTSYESGGWNAFFRLMAILSITLAALNILPIPVLDGGHLFFYVIEVIKGSPVRLKVRQMATQVGFYMLMALMVLVFYVDINRFFVDKIKALFN